MSVYYKDGKELNPENARVFGTWEYGLYGDLYYVHERLRLSNHNGEETWWIEYDGGAGTEYGVPTGTNQTCGSEGARIVSKEDAFMWLQEHDLLDPQKVKDYFYDFVEQASPKMKKESVVSAKCDELFNRVWLIRHKCTHKPSKEAVAVAIKVRSELSSVPTDPSHFGSVPNNLEEHDMKFANHVEGWLAALRWVLDEDAGEFDDWLYDS